MASSSPLPVRAFQWDLARQVERLEWLLGQLPLHAEWGYQELYIHLEDAVEFPRLPGVARPDAYSYRQFERLVAAANRVGIKVVPIVNLLGHTQYLIKTKAWRDLNELRDADGRALPEGQICPLHPRTLEVAEKLMRDVLPFCTAGKIHVGLDESFHLGKHPASRREVARIGLDRHFARHVQRLHRLARGLDLRMGIWADMLYYVPDAIPHLPEGLIAYEWYYYGFQRWPRLELFNFSETDITTALRQRNIALYGCAMNSGARYEILPHFGDRLENIMAWWRHLPRIKAEGFLVTSWEAHRIANDLTSVINAAAASLWLDDDSPSPQEMLARGFRRVFGGDGRKAAKIALSSDRHPFGGYPRWQVNDRWDVASKREPLRGFVGEERHFRRWQKVAHGKGIPKPLRDSMDLRYYLAERDLFIRRASRELAKAADVARFRTALIAGKRAARAMWRSTRTDTTHGPNETILAADERRLAQWTAGKPLANSPWQLCYRVWNFAPALQLVGVEQRQPDGTWAPAQSCYTIEFQNRAAQPKGEFIREHAAPITWDGVTTKPQLRVFVRGVGQVKVGDVVLTDGTVFVRPANWGRRSWRVLGRRAPRTGLPEIDWKKNQATIPLRFR